MGYLLFIGILFIINEIISLLQISKLEKELREKEKEIFRIETKKDKEIYKHREMIIDTSVLDEISLCEIEIEAEIEKREKIKLVSRLRKV